MAASYSTSQLLLLALKLKALKFYLNPKFCSTTFDSSIFDVIRVFTTNLITNPYLTVERQSIHTHTHCSYIYEKRRDEKKSITFYFNHNLILLWMILSLEEKKESNWVRFSLTILDVEWSVEEERKRLNEEEETYAGWDRKKEK